MTVAIAAFDQQVQHAMITASIPTNKEAYSTQATTTRTSEVL